LLRLLTASYGTNAKSRNVCSMSLSIRGRQAPDLMLANPSRTPLLEMIKTIRENREDDGFRLLIERKHGIWEIELKSARVPKLERGTGAEFNQAWGNITETIP
jgi:hypothetical protein